jgi:hypothetical protein
VIVFLIIIGALLLGFLALRFLAGAGYDAQRIRTLGTMHYWFYAAAFSLFGIDLVFKIFLALFFRSKDEIQ